MEILMVRHGETDWNVAKKLQGKTDIELNENGIKQAMIVAESLKEEKIDVIIASPLKRTRKTAEIIGKKIGCKVIYNEGLIERNCGEFEGKKGEDFDRVAFWSYKRNLKYERAEGVRDFFDRIFETLDEITNEYKGKRVLIVSHGGVSLPVNCYFNGIPDEDNILYMGGLKNCEVARYKKED